METEYRASKRQKTTRIPRKFQKKGTKAVATKKLKALVKSVINGQAEKKNVNFFNSAGLNTSVLASDWSGFNAWILTSDTTSRAMYNIAQGTGQGQRVGNQVRTHKMTLKLAMFANPEYADPQNYNACPLYVTMWIVKLMPHLDDTISQLQTVVQTNFFQNSGAAAAFEGNMSDLIKTPNKDQVVVLKRKTYKIGMGQYLSAFGSGSGNNASQQYINNDSVMSVTDTLDITKYVPLIQTFNDGDNLTTKRRSYLFFTSARCDGKLSQSSLGFATGTRMYQTSIGIDYQYTDM